MNSELLIQFLSMIKEKSIYKISEFKDKYQDQVIHLIDSSLKYLGVIPVNEEMIDDPDLYHISEVYSGRGKFFIMLENDVVVGTVAIKDIGDNFAKLHRMFVKSDLHGTGLGQQLLDTAISFAKEQKFSKLILNTHLLMKRAHSFYEKNGFLKVGKNKNKFKYEMKLELNMKKYLFICYGNIGRSQMAEAFYNNFTGTTDSVSAGIKNLIEKYNGHPSKKIIQVMNEVGIDLSKQRVKQVKQIMLEEAKEVIVFCDKKLCTEEIINNPKVQFIPVNDPAGNSVEQTRYIRDEIQRVVKSLIK